MPTRYHPIFISNNYKDFNYLEKIDQLIDKNRIEDAKQQLDCLESSLFYKFLYNIQYLKYDFFLFCCLSKPYTPLF